MAKIKIETIKKDLSEIESSVKTLAEIASSAVDLDALDEIIQEIRGKDLRKIPTKKLTGIMLNLSTELYICMDGLEESALKAAISKLIYKEAYSSRKSKAAGTVSDKEFIAISESMIPAVTSMVCEREFTTYKNKIEAAKEILYAIKKIITVQGGDNE